MFWKLKEELPVEEVVLMGPSFTRRFVFFTEVTEDVVGFELLS